MRKYVKQVDTSTQIADTPPMATKNDTRCAGQVADQPELFGEFSRFSVFSIHTRFDAVCWMVTDAERIDDVTGRPAVIRQAQSREAAIAGLA